MIRSGLMRLVVINKMTFVYVITKPDSPLSSFSPFASSSSDSCSVSSGKSGLWCDANLSCLRIFTPQKPWSPTVEPKTCWPPMMDSSSCDLLALSSTAPTYPRQPQRPEQLALDSVRPRPPRPSAKITSATYDGLLIPPSLPSLPPQSLVSLNIPAAAYPLLALAYQHSTFSTLGLIHLPQISAFSGVFNLERSWSVIVCLLALFTFSLLSVYFPHRYHHFPRLLLKIALLPFPAFLSLSLSPSISSCAHCKCGTWEYGYHNIGSFIPFCKQVRDGLGMET